MRTAVLFGGWLVVVILTTALTWQIVGAADAQVSERPASPLNVAAPAFSTQVTPSVTAPEPPATTTTPTVDVTTSGGLRFVAAQLACRCSARYRTRVLAAKRGRFETGARADRAQRCATPPERD